MALHIVILAAGNGKRMTSELPKVLHQLGGIPLLTHVVKTAQSLNPYQIHIVYGSGGDQVHKELSDLAVNWIHQKEQLGTGHAVLQALPNMQNEDKVLVLYGDVPLISTNTLLQLLRTTPHNGLGLIVTELDDPTGFGRIVRNEMGNITEIVEHKDANPQQLKIKEINTGILTTSALHLKNWLPKLKNNNKQKEYYLTDVVAAAVQDGLHVGGVMAHCSQEVQGVNDRWQLTKLERYYQYIQAKKFALAGVTIMDPYRLDIRGEVSIDSDVIIDVNVIMEGKVKIGKHCKIGSNVLLKDVTLANGCEIKANSIVEGAKLNKDSIVGPFARIRPGSVIGKKAKVGNFVEVKNTYLGDGSKASHLSYLGDATIGKNVNIGAGTITVNYDGANKWPTTIDDHAFIGCNTSLIAPVKIEAEATIGAGSTITRDAPKGKLTLARVKQVTLENWLAPKRRTNNKEKNNSTKV